MAWMFPVNALLCSCLAMASSFEIRLRCPLSLIVMRDSDSFINIEWKFAAFLGACGVARDALLEPSVFGRLLVTDFVVIWCVVVAHNLFIPHVVSAIERFASLYMDCVELCLSLPSTNDGVDIKRIKLQSVAPAP